VDPTPAASGLAEAVERLRRRFHDESDALRPALHRFCSRMLGSVTDGEDAVQETLALAFYKLPDLAQEESLKPWLFRIAHNKCMDLLRARRRFAVLDEEVLVTEHPEQETEAQELAERALVNLVVRLPPRERASVVLKDVLEYTLEETAEMTDSSVGSVKAALHRGRAKLRELSEVAPRHFTASERIVADEWVARFNRRDWDGVRALLSDDARLEIVGRRSAPFGNQYFSNYAKVPVPWKFAVATVDGEDAIVQFREKDGVWGPHAVVLLRIDGDRVQTVRDYVHIDYLLADATVGNGGP
jgi:RNA polymerase sigma-70 factor (ECF subfamily)